MQVHIYWNLSPITIFNLARITCKLFTSFQVRRISAGICVKMKQGLESRQRSLLNHVRNFAAPLITSLLPTYSPKSGVCGNASQPLLAFGVVHYIYDAS